MADQPERPIEKLLRECGKGRLPSEAFELHPANRRMLQEEVARTYPRKRPRFSWFGPGLVPKLAWGFCAFSVVGLAAWWSLSSTQKNASQSLLARNERILAPPAPVNTPMATPAGEIAVPNINLADNLATVAPEPAASTALSAQSPPAVQTDAASMVSMNLAEQAIAKDAAGKSESAAAPTLASSPLPSAPAGASFRYGLASSAAPSARQVYQSTTIQNFVRDQATKAKANEEQPAQPVLASFRFERAGSQIRIIDQDGSVYLGSLGAPQSQIQLKAAPTDRAVSSDLARNITPTRKASPAAASEQYTFHVSGTNRTLRGLVSFDGQWSTLTNASPLAQEMKEVNRGAALDKQISAGSGADGRISGTAVIQGGAAIHINATSVRP